MDKSNEAIDARIKELLEKDDQEYAAEIDRQQIARKKMDEDVVSEEVNQTSDN